MESRWLDTEALAVVERYRDVCNADVALRVYTSRLIGNEPSLVLHGGGNTSVKTTSKDELGQSLDVLCVKGSGSDLGTLEPSGLPALRLGTLQALRKLDTLSDEAMVNAQRTRMLDASGPNPSVETLLHAFLPHKFIDHSHADVILSLVDQPDALRLCAERYGHRFGIVPYVMPGFALAKLAAEVYEQSPAVEGLLLLQHGLFTFGSSARESYERHIAAVHEAQQFCLQRRYWSTHRPSRAPNAPLAYHELAPTLRGVLSGKDRRYTLHLRKGGEIDDFLADPRLEQLSQIGCATPDHVIRTKRFPLLLHVGSSQSEQTLRAMLDERIAAYRQEYLQYVQRQMTRKAIKVVALAPDPRVILVPGIGMITTGANLKEARIVADIYEHTISVIRHAEAVGRYQALPEDDIFDMEYWSLEQAKLQKGGGSKPLAGRVVYITGAARGIGAATARSFAQQGAELYLVDRDPVALAGLGRELGCAHEALDLCDERAVRQSVLNTVEQYGGLDGVVSNAGTAPQGAIDELDTQALQASLDINLFAHQWVASCAASIMRRQARGGFLLFNVSKAAWNPGAGFGPYAIAKAALLALMKQYALELGAHGIRSNAVNADRVRTGLLDEGELQARASARGLDADAYFRSNLLGREVGVHDVAQAFVSLALSEATTGSVLTVDGGNIAASPR